jgi:uncharacterized protein (TIGR03435 family)
MTTPWLISHGWPSWIGAIANHLWQSTVFAIAIGLLSVAFRRYQARVRYALWFAASLKFVVPVSLLIGLGTQLPPFSTPVRAPATVVSTVVWQISVPFDDSNVVTPTWSASESAPAVGLMSIVFLTWISGVLAIAYMRWRAWRHLNALVDVATASNSSGLALPPHVEVRRVSGVTEPSVLGFIRPVILLPSGIESYLNRDQLDAVLAHELCHIDRHDNLTAVFHMLVEAVFWFHPAVWWIGGRLIHERERACDEHVLTTCGRPDVYAEGILNVCRHYLDAPLACLASVGGSDLKERIKMIIAHRVGRRLGVAARVVLVLLGTSAIGAPIVAGARAAARASAPQAAAAGRPAFEVASIKEARAPIEDVQAGQFHVGIDINGSRADYGFLSLADLISYAYRVKPSQLSGPSWMNETRWDILARIPEGHAANLAPEMMQSLLAERFRLSIHRESRERSVYALVVGKGGLKIKEAAADEEAGAGSGLNVRFNNDGIAISGGATGTMRLAPGPDGGMQMQMAKVTMAALAHRLTQFMDGPVVDATELTGNYQVTLNVPIDAMAGMAFVQKLAALAGLGSFGVAGGSGAPGTSGAAIVQAVKSLGLELQSRKAAVETIIVDRVQKSPTAN